MEIIIKKVFVLDIDNGGDCKLGKLWVVIFYFVKLF